MRRTRFSLDEQIFLYGRLVLGAIKLAAVLGLVVVVAEVAVRMAGA